MRAQRIYKSQGQEEYWPVLHLRTLSFSSTPKNLKLERRYHNKAILINFATNSLSCAPFCQCLDTTPLLKEVGESLVM
jgi:hypothetical protein